MNYYPQRTKKESKFKEEISDELYIRDALEIEHRQNQSFDLLHYNQLKDIQEIQDKYTKTIESRFLVLKSKLTELAWKKTQEARRNTTLGVEELWREWKPIIL